MSTRAMYEFTDQYGKRTVYVHHDGYPTGAANKFEITLKSGLMWELPRYEADEFAAAFVAANKTCPGSVRLLTGPEEASDIEYYYIISQSKNEGPLMIQANFAHFSDENKFLPAQFYNGTLNTFIANAKQIEKKCFRR